MYTLLGTRWGIRPARTPRLAAESMVSVRVQFRGQG